MLTDNTAAGSQLPYLPKARFFDIPTRPAPKLVVAVPPVVAPSNEPLRDQFIRNLSSLEGPSVSLVNDIDDSSPPITFNFINVSIIGEGVDKLHEDFMVGCECRPENGRNCGCEYRTCLCIQDSYRDHRGNLHFPYAAGGQARGCLRPMYLESRNHIYECNAKCNCRSNCKNKVVQHGRQVPLEIFKTTNRGWGKCDLFFGVLANSDTIFRPEMPRASTKGAIHRHLSW